MLEIEPMKELILTWNHFNKSLDFGYLCQTAM